MLLSRRQTQKAGPAEALLLLPGGVEALGPHRVGQPHEEHHPRCLHRVLWPSSCLVTPAGTFRGRQAKPNSKYMLKIFGRNCKICVGTFPQTHFPLLLENSLTQDPAESPTNPNAALKQSAFKTLQSGRSGFRPLLRALGIPRGLSKPLSQPAWVGECPDK